MSKRLVLLHTVASLVEPFAVLGREILPGDVDVVHVADELLLKVVLAESGLAPFIYQRVASHVAAAAAAGADAVMFTCSSISPCAEVARRMVSIPVLKIDEPMVDKAIGAGERIGVVATVPTTLGPTTDLVRERAARLGKPVSVDPVLCDGAFDALLAGDTKAHDAIVSQAIIELAAGSDVILLAQASMARVVGSIPDYERVVPILSSPRLAMERARDVLA
jgi:Asp/Glu/hydantoin racemase